MRIEVICTGDELLNGLTADTNSPFFMGKLAVLGEKVSRSQTVGDVREEIIAILQSTAERADAVLVSGGLGPTADDVTAECAAKAAGVPLIEDAGILKSLKERFAKRGIEFSANNARQALVPQGAEVVRNPVGSAPMFILQIGQCTAFFVPGVPREYRALVEQEVLPRLAKMIERQSIRIFRAARILKTVGLPESHLDRMVEPLAKQHPRVYFGFRTKAPENHLRLLASGGSQEAASAALAAAEGDCRKVLGQFLFGTDDESFSFVIGALLRQKKSTLALAESCTGGRAAEILSAEAGASDYFLGSAVTYSNSLKVRWAGVTEELLSRFDPVSEEVATAMADGIRRACGATYGVGITGFAGPAGGNQKDPIGTVYCAVSGPEGIECQRALLLGDRSRVQDFAAYHALDMLRRRLIGKGV